MRGLKRSQSFCPPAALPLSATSTSSIRDESGLTLYHNDCVMPFAFMRLVLVVRSEAESPSPTRKVNPLPSFWIQRPSRLLV